MTTINYTEIAKEWLHGVLLTEAEEFSERYQHIEESMQEDHGKQFDMEEFVVALESVEKEIYKILGGATE